MSKQRKELAEVDVKLSRFNLLAYSSNLEMQAKYFSEKSISLRATWSYNPVTTARNSTPTPYSYLLAVLFQLRVY
jgi:hypothetical protein